MQSIKMYEKYFSEIVKTINEQVQKKWPTLTSPLLGVDAGVGLFAWANDRVPELYIQERNLDVEINNLWNKSETQNPKSEFEIFKAKVLAWGRVVLQIYKKFAEEKS